MVHQNSHPLDEASVLALLQHRVVQRVVGLDLLGDVQQGLVALALGVQQV